MNTSHQNMDEFFMNRCLELAGLAIGNVAPNPMVGAVIVYENLIIGEGYHIRYGKAHAEVNAIAAVEEKSLLSKSTLYVNLEPCSHSGKTPPCTDFILKNKIPKVVIGTIDPNSLVAGKGIKKLKSNGIEIIEGVLKNNCERLNRRFFTFYTKKRPYIILKWAQSADGFIDILRNEKTPIGPNWISNDISRMLVHKWRSEEQAIMIGTNTAQIDNPKLTTREWEGKSPCRLVIDRKLRLPGNIHLMKSSHPTIIFNEKKHFIEEKTEFIKIDFNEKLLEQIFTHLFDKGLQSVIIEGGRTLLKTFIDSNYWDEARVFIGNKLFNKGIQAPILYNQNIETLRIKEDILNIFYNRTSS